MEGREALQGEGMADGDRQALDSVTRRILRDQAGQVPVDFQASGVDLNGNLPTACGAAKELVEGVADDLPGDRGQPRVICDPPEEGVGVEKDPPEARPPSRSSGRGASKSRETLIIPAAEPGSRCIGVAAIGTSRATGFPAFPMMISSPAMTRSSI